MITVALFYNKRLNLKKKKKWDGYLQRILNFFLSRDTKIKNKMKNTRLERMMD